MRFTVCESMSPPIKETLQNHFILWYSNVDNSTDYWPYANGLGSYILPLIAVISMDDSTSYLDRTTSVQYAADFYNRLKTHVGDIDHSVSITLEDVILALQTTVNLQISPIHKDGDIDNDQRIGLQEAIYLLQELSQ